MSSEVRVRGSATGQTLYFRILGSGSAVWSTSGGTGGFEAYNSLDWADYAVSLTEQGSTAIYQGNFPAAVPAGVFDIDARRQIGASPATTDVTVATGSEEWNGTKTVPLSDLATSGQLSQLVPIKLARSYQIKDWSIYLRSSADHVTPFTSGVISGQIQRDNSTTWQPLQSGAFTEAGQGYYVLQALTSGDLDANSVRLLFTGTGVSGGTADPLPQAAILQRISGSV